MNRRHFLKATLGGMAALAAGHPLAARAQSPAGRPLNFLVILADDLGAKELACYGHPTHKTPNLDRLAETGVRFETAYTAPICHPTRVMILTGQYGCHNGVYNFAGRRGGPQPDDPAEDIGQNHITFAEVLKERGYATALAGKWQLSGRQPTLIHDCGFDEYCVWAYLNYLPEGVKHTGAWEGEGKPARYWHPSIVKDGEYVSTTPEDYGPNIFTDFLIDFARRHKDEPMLLYYPMCLTHGPHNRTPDNIEADDADYRDIKKVYGGTVEYMDKLVGRLVAALDEMGLRENTVILFTGDNGTGGEGKGQPTELGARVPLIVNAPGIVKARGATKELSDLSDVMPTLADFAGAEMPKDRPIDGRSLAPFLRGETDSTREWIFAFIADRRMLRTKRWLLEDNSPLHYGRLYDCGESRNGSGYKDVTNSDAPEVIEARAYFDELLQGLPAPVLPEEGEPAAAKEPAQKAARKQKKAARGKSGHNPL